MPDYKKMLWIVLGICIVSLAGFLFTGSGNIFSDFIMMKRLQKVAAVLLVGYVIGVSSLLFQTITNNRILTPSVIGFDQLYLLIQGLSLFIFGKLSFNLLNVQENFVLNVILMVFFAELLYRFLFRNGDSNLYFVLLAGVICGILFRSVFSFFMILLDPDQFDILQDKMFASFSAINTDLLWISLIILVLTSIYAIRFLPLLDVFLLGKDNAHNLGVEVYSFQRKILFIISIMISVSTALVGPITFLGLLTVNIVYMLFNTFRHSVLLPATVLVSWIFLFVGLILVERIFSFSANLTVIINGVGGVYFLYLLLKGAK